jgi:hypothetical protein
MSSLTIGKNISEVEIGNIDPYGIWLLIKDKEYFLPYNEYPWFENAKISEIFNVQLLHEKHLYWPELDIDLNINTLNNPQQVPLIYI